ncbi:uridine-cytidine kinase [Listeria monocytogenes]
MTKKPIVVGVTGGSGSGKTSVTKAICNHFSGHSILMIAQDVYYHDQANISFEDRLKVNYDHPLAFDTDLLISHKKEVEIQEPREVIILEGILILEDKQLRDLMDIKVYVDTDDDIRFIRRLLRDMKERGRTMDSVIEQYLSVVKPMHNEFIEPTKKFADIIIPEGGENHVAIDLMTTKIESILQKHV